MSVCIGKELGRRDGGNAKLLDAEPRELEITWAVRNMRRERVVCRQLHLGEVDEDKVASLWLRVLVAISECLYRCTTWRFVDLQAVSVRPRLC